MVIGAEVEPLVVLAVLPADQLVGGVTHHGRVPFADLVALVQLGQQPRTGYHGVRLEKLKTRRRGHLGSDDALQIILNANDIYGNYAPLAGNQLQIAGETLVLISFPVEPLPYLDILQSKERFMLGHIALCISRFPNVTPLKDRGVGFSNPLSTSALLTSPEIPLLAGFTVDDHVAVLLRGDIVPPEAELQARRRQNPDAYRALFLAMRASSSHVRMRSLYVLYRFAVSVSRDESELPSQRRQKYITS